MASLNYQINITYVPNRLLNPFAGTQAAPSFYGGWYTAQMPELGLFATGPSHAEALATLLISASNSTGNGQNPLSTIKTW